MTKVGEVGVTEVQWILIVFLVFCGFFGTHYQNTAMGDILPILAGICFF